jgi:hypothetical protein
MRWKQESHRALRPDQSQELCLHSYGMLRWSPVKGPYFLNNLSDQDLTFATYLYLDGCRPNRHLLTKTSKEIIPWKGSYIVRGPWRGDCCRILGFRGNGPEPFISLVSHVSCSRRNER